MQKIEKRSLKFSPCHRVKSHIFEVKIAKIAELIFFVTGGRGIFFPVSLFFFQKTMQYLMSLNAEQGG